MIVDKGEFQVLKRLQEHPVLTKREDESDAEFDLACEHARELLNRGLLHTKVWDPFSENTGRSGGRYLRAGLFSLSATASKIVEFRDFEALKAAFPKKSQWTLTARLTLLGVIVAIIAVIVALQ